MFKLLLQRVDGFGTMARTVLRDDQWDRIKDLLPGKPGDRGVTAADNRLFVEAVLWLLRTGAPWRDLPPEFGRWHTVYMRFARWQKSGVWERLFQAVSADADLEEVFIDSTAIRAHLHAAGAPKKTVRKHWVDLAAAGARRST
jgi:transposase